MGEILGFKYIDNSIYILEENKDLIIENIKVKLDTIQNDLELHPKEKNKNIRDLIYGDIFESFIKTEQNKMTIDLMTPRPENYQHKIKNIHFDKLMELRRLGLDYIADNDKLTITEFLDS